MNRFLKTTCLAMAAVAQTSWLRCDEPEFMGKLVEMKTLENISVSELAKQVSLMDVLVLGEEHDNDTAHKFQLDIIKELVDQRTNLAVSMEMFERDVQGVLDEYLAGRIDEPVFLAQSRPWNNYAQHYKPIIELAKERKLPVIAANTPREVASKISRNEKVEQTMTPFFARYTTSPEDRYWDKFLDAMKGHAGVEDREGTKPFYNAQCLKDDTMAESITDFLAKHTHRPVLVVHLCGRFHSDFGLGTVARILERNPIARIAIVSTESVESLKDLNLKKEIGRSHYMMVVPPKKPNEESEETKPKAQEGKEAKEEN